jgi:hypothetical protein
MTPPRCSSASPAATGSIRAPAAGSRLPTRPTRASSPRSRRRSTRARCCSSRSSRRCAAPGPPGQLAASEGVYVRLRSPRRLMEPAPAALPVPLAAAPGPASGRPLYKLVSAGPCGPPPARLVSLVVYHISHPPRPRPRPLLAGGRCDQRPGQGQGGPRRHRTQGSGRLRRRPAPPSGWVALAAPSLHLHGWLRLRLRLALLRASLLLLLLLPLLPACPHCTTRSLPAMLLGGSLLELARGYLPPPAPPVHPTWLPTTTTHRRAQTRWPRPPCCTWWRPP